LNAIFDSQEAPRITHQIPGRIRISFPNITNAARLEQALYRVPGTEQVQVNLLTGSVLVQFEDRYVDGATIFREACRANRGSKSRTRTSKLRATEPAGIIDRAYSVPDSAASQPRAKAKPVSRDAARIGVELVLGIVAADLAAIVACIVAAAIVGRQESR
jgi:copper chaperone CopZ